MQLTDTDFALLGLPERFSLDPATLETKRKAALRQTHPDRFVDQEPAAQRVAMQWTARINEAYARLKDPVTRGAYLCELWQQRSPSSARPSSTSSSTVSSTAFLTQQMQWREALEEASSPEAFAALAQEVASVQSELLHALEDALATGEQSSRLPTNLQEAQSLVHRLMFIAKFDASLRNKRFALQAQGKTHSQQP